MYERSYFDVKTANIPHDLAANVVNYVNRLDPISWIGDWPGILRALFDNGANVTFVDHPKTAKIFDHMFLAESYSSAWKSECKNYIRGKDQ